MNLAVKSAIVGFAVGTIPLWMWVLLRNSLTLPGAVQDGVNYLLFPGVAVSLLLNGVRVHDVSRVVIVLLSCLFYTIASYIIFRLKRGKRGL